MGAGGELEGIVVVPRAPGPLLWPHDPAPRDPDDLDQLIDELLPDTQERAGWFDAGLALSGAGVAAGSLILGWPVWALAGGIVAIGVGCVLPIRSLARRVTKRRGARRASSLLSQGEPLDVTHRNTAALAESYERVVAIASTADRAMSLSVIGAAHAAVTEVATLLAGRAPTSAIESEYVDTRVAAITELARALRDAEATHRPPHTADSVAETRMELESSGFNSLARLRDLTDEIHGRDDVD
jgi:hypothetical protein